MSVLMVAVTKTPSEVVADISLRRLLAPPDNIGAVAVQQVTSDLETAVTTVQWEWCDGRVGLECGALALELVGLGVLGSWDVLRTLQELHGETTLNVPRDVAVHEPCTWIVRLEGNDSVA